MIDFTVICIHRSGAVAMLNNINDLSGLMGVYAAGGMTAALIIAALAWAG
jgi:hypothetical protein